MELEWSAISAIEVEEMRHLNDCASEMTSESLGNIIYRMTIIQHLETHLGEISKGWRDKHSKNRIQVVEFHNQPFDGVVTYITLGLSDVVFSIAEDKKIRQELVFSSYKRFSSEQIASFLSTFADHLVAKDKGLLRGDVFGPSSSIILGTLLNSVYAAIPVVFDESICVYKETTPPTVLVWIIPIHEEEANFIRTAGWNKFEELMEEEDPDLWDLGRTSLI